MSDQVKGETSAVEYNGELKLHKIWIDRLRAGEKVDGEVDEMIELLSKVQAVNRMIDEGDYKLASINCVALELHLKGIFYRMIIKLIGKRRVEEKEKGVE